MTESRLFLDNSSRRPLAGRLPDGRRLLARALLVALYVIVAVGAFIVGHGGL